MSSGINTITIIGEAIPSSIDVVEVGNINMLTIERIFLSGTLNVTDDYLLSEEGKYFAWENSEARILAIFVQASDAPDSPGISVDIAVNTTTNLVNTSPVTTAADTVEVNSALNIDSANNIINQVQSHPLLSKEVPNFNVIPTEYALLQNYPNPFNPTTEIRFRIPETSNVLLRVFDILGREVRTLANADYSVGFHTIRWDGMDNLGNEVSSGIYFYQLKVDDFSQVRKMNLLR